MVQLRTVEELSTCFPWASPPEMASSSSSAPGGADEPTAVPQIALKGAPTYGTTHGAGLDATGESGGKLSRTPGARSGPPFVLRTTVPTSGDPTAEEGRPLRDIAAGQAVPAGRSLMLLPSRHRIVTEYEPHFRRETVDHLSDLFDRLRARLGKPETAARVFSLKRFMAAAYVESASQAETRSFASAISLLQDFLRPHWSEISVAGIDDIAGELNWLRGLPIVSPKDLERWHERLARVLGGLSIEVSDDEEAPSELTCE